MYQFLEIYRNQLLNEVIPFWSRHSLDRERGGYFTCLEADGTLYDPRKYIWLQGRQVWMFSKLFNALEPRAEWLEIAKLGADFLRRFARRDDGRVYFALSREGEPVKLQRKIFSECFYAMGLIEYARACGDGSIREEALDALSFIETMIAEPERFGMGALSGNPRASGLAIPMIMLGLLDVFRPDLPEAVFFEKSNAYVNAIKRHYDPELRLLRESVGLDSSILHLPEGRLINPGHSIEAAWFLLHFAQASADSDLQHLALNILEGSLEYGWDKQHGGLIYFMDSAGHTSPYLEWNMKLWWPHTEAIYALIAAWCETGEQRWVDWQQRVHAYSMKTFVDSQHGEWFGYADRQGNLTHKMKGGSYKGCFHVPRALLLSVLALEQKASRSGARA